MGTFAFDFPVEDSVSLPDTSPPEVTNLSDTLRSKSDVVEHRLKFAYWSEKLEGFCGDCVPMRLGKQRDSRQLKYLSIESLRTLMEREKYKVEGDYFDLLFAKLAGTDSDLQKGVYEGGFKIWECTYDLLHSLEQVEFKGKKVLDLGCGSGLLGILAFTRGASYTCFQDYNGEVIEAFTIPNFVLNARKGKEEGTNARSYIDSELEGTVQFFSGDWLSMTRFFQDQGTQFDVILSSETIYNEENYEKLYLLLEICLKKDGIAVFAAKTYYFGVGGSTKVFQDRLTRAGKFQFTKLLETKEGVNREVFRVEHESLS